MIAPPASPAIIRTVLGDIEPGSLERLDYHEHLFQVVPRQVDGGFWGSGELGTVGSA